MDVAVKESKPKAFDEMNLKLKELDGLEAKVGWFSSARYENGRPVAAVAAGNELGIPSRSIPARPFMRPTAEEKKGGEWSDVSKKLAKKMLDGTITPEDVMELLAMKAEADVQKTIASITSPPLSPITIAARAYRQHGKTVTGSTIGEIARGLAGEGNLRVTASQMAAVSTKPLNDTGHMIATMTHVVGKAES